MTADCSRLDAANLVSDSESLHQAAVVFSTNTKGQSKRQKTMLQPYTAVTAKQ